MAPARRSPRHVREGADGSSIDLTVIVGAPRSGTTWLLDILSAHPEVAGVFESWLFHKGFGGLFSWTHWDEDFLDVQQRRLGYRPGPTQLITRDQLRRDVAELAARWLTNAAPSHERQLAIKELWPPDIPIIAELFPRSRFIHIVRDGRDVVASQLAAARSWAPETVVPRPRAARLARRWVSHVNATRSALANVSNEHLEIRYEALRQFQQATQLAIFQFCGLPLSKELNDLIVEQTTFENLADTGDGRFRRRGRIGDWHFSLGPIERTTVALCARELLREFPSEHQPRLTRSCLV